MYSKITYIKKAGEYIVEIYERIRELRKNHLRMTQTDFGDRLGVSRSVIKNIELNALARPDQKLSLIKLICKEFSVSEEWLLNGTEPMFVEPDTFSLDEFVKQRGATDLELQIIKTYFDIDPDTRGMLVDHFRKGLAAFAPVAVQKEKTVDELEEEYKKIVLNSASKKDSTAMSTTSDTATDRKAVNDN